MLMLWKGINMKDVYILAVESSCDDTSIAIVKNGKKGSFISEDKVITQISTYGDTVPVDTTGAGDTYAAGFLYGYLTGHSCVESCNIASYLAGRIISKIGAQFDTRQLEDIKVFLKDNFG